MYIILDTDSLIADQPAHCTQMPKEDYIYGIPRENCTSLHRVVQFECDGPCGRVKELCCHPVEHEVKSVRIRCEDQPTVTETVRALFYFNK